MVSELLLQYAGSKAGAHHSAWLGHGYASLVCKACLEQQLHQLMSISICHCPFAAAQGEAAWCRYLGQLSRLARPCLSYHDHHRVFPDGPHKHICVCCDGQLGLDHGGPLLGLICHPGAVRQQSQMPRMPPDLTYLMTQTASKRIFGRVVIAHLALSSSPAHCRFICDWPGCNTKVV